jgi:ABC-2 type transport system permease protein
MAVYKKTYRRYDGPLTPGWARFLVLARYSWEDLQRRRFLTLFFLGTLIWPLLCALGIYLRHNLAALDLMGIRAASMVKIDSTFFLTFLGVQSMFAFFLNSFLGPGLVAPDLANNALPLYLARPFSRVEYILGRITVLLVLLSLMTWIPGEILFGLQSYLEGWDWFQANKGLAWALFAGSGVWIVFLALLSLSVSAWVKWKPIAGGLLFGLFFVAAGFGEAINSVLRTKWGNLINISNLVGSIWVSLFEKPMERGSGAVFFRVARGEEIPVWMCWVALGLICLFCLWLLGKKIRGVEVVSR